MAWLKVEPFVGEVFTLAEIKNFVRVDNDEDNDLLRMLEGGAVGAFERFAGRLLTTRDVECSIFVDNYARLPIGYVKVVKELTKGFTVEGDGVYGLGTCEFKYTAEGVGVVEQDSGGDSIVAIPDEVKLGLLKWIATNYEDRQDTTEAGVARMPDDSRSLWKPYKVIVA